MDTKEGLTLRIAEDKHPIDQGGLARVSGLPPEMVQEGATAVYLIPLRQGGGAATTGRINLILAELRS